MSTVDRGPPLVSPGRDPSLPLVMRFQLVDDMTQGDRRGVAYPLEFLAEDENRYYLVPNRRLRIEVFSPLGLFHGVGTQENEEGEITVNGSRGYAIWMPDNNRYEIIQLACSL